MVRHTQVGGFVLGVLLFVATPLATAQITFVKIADTSTINPNNACEGCPDGPLKDLSRASISGTNVVFRASPTFVGGSFFDPGIYKGSGASVTKVIDTLDGPLLPNISADRVRVGDSSYDGAEVFFFAEEILVGGSGIDVLYTENEGVFTKIVGQGDAQPDFGTFSRLNFPAVGDGKFAYAGSNTINSGPNSLIYQDGANKVAVARANDPVPGTSTEATFSQFRSVAVQTGQVAFVASISDNSTGLYYWNESGALIEIANNTVAIPGGSGTFSFIRSDTVSFTGNIITFIGSGTMPSQSGVYQYLLPSGPLSRIADLSTEAPSGEQFIDFTGVATDGIRVAFVGVLPASGAILPDSISLGPDKGISGDNGIYYTSEEDLLELVYTGDLIDGKPAVRFEIDSEGLDNGNIAFVAEFGGFSDDNEGIFRTILPGTSASTDCDLFVIKSTSGKVVVPCI